MARLGHIGACCALALALTGLYGCSAGPAGTEGSGAAPATAASGTASDAVFRNTSIGCDLELLGPVELAHATQVTVDDYAGGYRLICTAGGERYLLVPEGGSVPEGLDADIVPIALPLDDVYLVSTGMICVLDELDRLGSVSVSSVSAEDSPVPALAQAIESGSVAYGGRYSAPDYELIASRGCTLALENTNINHAPDVRSKLEDLGVSVFCEYSSKEPTVLGRLEWMRIMGMLFGREDEADARFAELERGLEEIGDEEPTGKSVAFFSIDADGAAVTRRSGDYFSQMVEMAGGAYVSFDPSDGENANSYLTVEMEEFYATARDADVIIYNTTQDESVASLADLVAKNPLLSDFRAVQTGEVYRCDQFLYQQMTSADDIIGELRGILEGGSTTGTGTFFEKLG